MNKNKLWKVITTISIERILIYVISWGIGGILLYNVYYNIDLDNPNEIGTIYYIFIIFGIGLLLLPFMKSIKVGNILELERKLEDTNKELENFKTQINMSLGIISTSINSISNNNNSASIYNYGSFPPSSNEVKDSEKELNEVVKENQAIGRIEIDNEDNVLELVKLRIKLETILKEQVFKLDMNYNKRPYIIGMLNMYRNLSNIYPELVKVKGSFNFVNGVCNQAVHGEYITNSEAKEAIDMGKKLISYLEILFKYEKREFSNQMSFFESDW